MRLRAAQLATPRQKRVTNMPEIAVAKSQNQLPALVGSDYSPRQTQTAVQEQGSAKNDERN